MAYYKRRNSGTGNRIYSDKLSRGQRIFVTVMSIALVTYAIIQLIRVNGI